jgi:hypothetical protein
MEEKTKEEFPVDFFMALSGSVDAVNGYAVLGLSSQRFFMEKYHEAQTEEDKKKIIEELKK